VPGRLLLLAWGIGITPLLALLGELPCRLGEATLVYRARNQAEAVFRGELEELARRRGVRLVHLYGRRADRPSWLPHAHAHIDDVRALREIEPRLVPAHVYLCGPAEWTRAARRAVRAAGVPAQRVHTEQFA
jgi:ferredoxin-NADP reductase